MKFNILFNDMICKTEKHDSKKAGAVRISNLFSDKVVSYFYQIVSREQKQMSQNDFPLKIIKKFNQFIIIYNL